MQPRKPANLVRENYGGPHLGGTQGGGCARHCGEIDLPVTKSTSTHHFRVLRESGVISQEREGTARVNKLRRADLDSRFPGLLDSVLKSA